MVGTNHILIHSILYRKDINFSNLIMRCECIWQQDCEFINQGTIELKMILFVFVVIPIVFDRGENYFLLQMSCIFMKF